MGVVTRKGEGQGFRRDFLTPKLQIENLYYRFNKVTYLIVLKFSCYHVTPDIKYEIHSILSVMLCKHSE